MGFFVGSDPENSLILLRRLPELKARYRPAGAGFGVAQDPSCASWRTVPPAEAGAASLAAELFAAAQGADYIRTHAPGTAQGWA